MTTQPRDQRIALWLRRYDWLVLIAIAVATIVLWRFSWGGYLLWPFTIFCTWCHEMGHGMMAICLGGGFQMLELFADGSGRATHLGPFFFGPFGRAMVAAAGPLAPSFFGAAMIVASRRRETTRIGLVVLAVLMFASLIWVRGWFAFPFVAVMAVAVAAVAAAPSDHVQRFVLQLLGVQACISLWQDLNYLFSPGGQVGGDQHVSDTAQMAEQLWLPYWFWGALLTAIALAALISALIYAFGGGARSGIDGGK